MILSGDVGATKTELALFKENKSKLEKKLYEKYTSKDFSTLEEIISLFLKNKKENIDCACIGIPGPVEDGKVKSTNLSWELDEKILSEKLNIGKFKLTNDLEAIATAVIKIEEKDLIKIYDGDGIKRVSNKVILAPGTGLGQAALIYANGKYKVNPSEGGHMDFAPTNEIEIELLKYMQQKFGHVSYERIASGMGIVNIFNFLKDINYEKVSDEFLNRIKNEDAAAVISSEALIKKNKICEKTLDIFASVLGAQAGNMVLGLSALGGVYLGGGVPMKLIDKLIDGTFLKSFLNKGRLVYFVEKTPVYVIRNSSAGLFGAAEIARKL